MCLCVRVCVYVRKHVYTIFFCFLFLLVLLMFSLTNPRIICCTHLRICWLEHVAAIQWASIIITIRLNESWVIKQSKFTIIFGAPLLSLSLYTRPTSTHLHISFCDSPFRCLCEDVCFFSLSPSSASLFLIFRHMICCKNTWQWQEIHAAGNR